MELRSHNDKRFEASSFSLDKDSDELEETTWIYDTNIKDLCSRESDIETRWV